MTDAPGTSPALPTAPIFVIGSARSGTTMLRLMLDSHARISSGEETHFLQQMEPVVGKQWRLLERYGFPREYWLDRLRHLYGDFQAEYAARTGQGPLGRQGPRQHPHSALRRRSCSPMPSTSTCCVTATMWWPRTGIAGAIVPARGRRAARGASTWRRPGRSARRWALARFLEVRYEVLVADPEAELRRLVDFLGEEWDPAMLAFDRAEHDGTERYTQFTAERREQGGDGSAVYQSRVGAGRASLDPVLRTMLRRSSGALLDELGYSER